MGKTDEPAEPLTPAEWKVMKIVWSRKAMRREGRLRGGSAVRSAGPRRRRNPCSAAWSRKGI